MGSVPFIYINLIAICCYLIMILAFLAAQKTPEIKAFIIVLFAFVLWTGGSLLMRLQVFPGVDFWFYVSLLSLFSIPLLFYFFACSFANDRGYFLKIVWSVGTIALLAVTLTGFFLEPPTAVRIEAGATYFVYVTSRRVVIPSVFLVLEVLTSIFVIAKLARKKGIRTPGLIPIILAMLIIAVGNLMQMIPGNLFPTDTLSGIIFAVFLVFALARKRVFKPRLLVSPNVLLFASTVLCFLLVLTFHGSIEASLAPLLGIPKSYTNVFVVALTTALIIVLYMLMRKVIFTIFAFSKEQKQSELIKNFSQNVTQSLESSDIVERLTAVIRDEIDVSRVYIFLRENGEFLPRSAYRLSDAGSTTISAESGFVKYLESVCDHFMMDEFVFTQHYRALWQQEKQLFAALGIKVVAAIISGEEVIGIIMLPAKQKKKVYSLSEIEFLTTASPIAANAIRNAMLYERLFREARIDSLTGLYSFKYFMEKVDEDFAKYGETGLALVYLDIDDMKLFNQLYGVGEGDFALRRIAETISEAVGSNGTVFRHSGKVFAILLPNYDARSAFQLATEIQRQITAASKADGRAKKQITLSGGICVSPYSAGSAKELIENADIAVFNAKMSGKGRVNVFRSAREDHPARIHERAMEIIEIAEAQGNGHSSYTATVLALTAAIDAKDHYTYSHSQSVAYYASVLATSIGLSNDHIKLIYEASLLHDIGKISIPEAILTKTSGLTPEERVVMETHVNNSIEMIRHLPSMDYVIPAVIGHHERWDGKGYPRGIAGEDIPISARCLSIADSYDAMTSDRPYRKGMPVEVALERIEEGMGTQFDPEMAGEFVRLVRAGELSILGASQMVI